MKPKGYVRFKGDYKELKNLGFKFQKLYARNYMQWGNEELGLRVWKRGKDITFDEMNLYTLLKFLETYPTVRKMDGYIAFYKFHTDKNNFTYEPWIEENHQKYLSFMESFQKDYTGPELPYRTVVTVDLSTLEFLREWKAKGWWELVEYKVK